MILFSALHLNSRFDMMTISEISLNRPKVFPSFCMSPKILIDSLSSFCFFSLKLFPIAMRFSTEIISPYGGFPSQSGFLEFVVSP